MENINGAINFRLLNECKRLFEVRVGERVSGVGVI